ncbi:GHKL domain-containing protein [Ruminococcus sp.]|uniref:sensor histidine kinase n=1 Tax=Ruminococcus sp. TaxID=41978 RepID=UPI0025E39293|nr:GHKL domain-containing protein [Ruminococcus sp.]
MIWQICEYTATIIEYVIYADFMVRFLDVKKDKNKIISFFLIFLSDTLLTSVFNYFMNFEGILCVIRIALNISIAFFLLKGTLFEKAFSAIILDITALFVSFISLTLLGMLSGNSLEEMIESRGMIRLLNLFITKVFLFAVTRAILRIRGKNNLSFEFTEVLGVSFIFAITLVIGIGIFRANLSAGVDTDSPISLLIGFGLIAINIFTYILMKRISDKNRERENLLLDKAQNEAYFSQVTEYEKQLDDMRKIRHDIKNHLQCLAALISQNNNEQAEDYINDIIENKLDFGHYYIDTGNKVIDSVINMKLLQCKNDNITTVVHINKVDTNIEDADMCALLSNILDNAIEACSKETKTKEIHIDIMPRKGYANLVVKNAISDSVLERNPELKTTKENVFIHGIGMRSVSDIVKRYDGMLDFYENNNFFIADIWLPLKG